MSITLAFGQPDSSLMQLAAVIGSLGVAMSIAGFAGVFHRQSVDGPPRLEPDERVGPVFMIMLIGLGAWLLSQQIFISMRVQTQGGLADTAPTTQTSLSPIDTVVIGLLAAGVLLTVLIGSHTALRPNGLRRLGFGFRAIPQALLAAVISIVIILPLMYAVSAITQEAWDFIGFKHPNAHPLLRVLQDQDGFGIRALVIISAIFFAPPAEELLFRGHMQTAIAYALNQGRNEGSSRPNELVRWVAIILTSVVFALVHPGLWMMPPIFLLSICLGYAYERTGNLWVPILMHAAFNAANLFSFWSQQTGH